MVDERKATENSSESQRKECKLFPINLIWRKKNFCLINGFVRADAAAERVWVGPRESNFLIFLKVIDGENRHRMHFAGLISGRRNRPDGRRYTMSPLWPVVNFSIGGMFIAYLSTFFVCFIVLTLSQTRWPFSFALTVCCCCCSLLASLCSLFCPHLAKKSSSKKSRKRPKKWMKDSQQRGDIKIFRTISYLVLRVTAEKVVVWCVFCSLFNLISPTKVGKVGDLKQRQT